MLHRESCTCMLLLLTFDLRLAAHGKVQLVVLIDSCGQQKQSRRPTHHPLATTAVFSAAPRYKHNHSKQSSTPWAATYPRRHHASEVPSPEHESPLLLPAASPMTRGSSAPRRRGGQESPGAYHHAGTNHPRASPSHL